MSDRYTRVARYDQPTHLWLSDLTTHVTFSEWTYAIYNVTLLFVILCCCTIPLPPVLTLFSQYGINASDLIASIKFANGWTCLVEDNYSEWLKGRRLLYNTLFSREENFAKSEFEIFSREDIFANLLFTRKYLPAKISSRENIFSRKYPLAKISSCENILSRKSFACFVSVASFSLFAARWSGTPVAGLTLDPELASHRRNNGIIPTISNLDRSYLADEKHSARFF